MKELQLKQSIFDTDGLLFHLAKLSDAIPDGPRGVWIDNTFAESNPILRERVRGNFRFRFFTISPLHGIAPAAPIHLIHKISSQAIPGTKIFGNAVSLDLYAEALPPCDQIVSLIERARADGVDPVELTTLAQHILKDGYELSCEFINILRQDFGQYWLRPPDDLFCWSSIRYFSKPDERWFKIDAEDGFEEKLLRRDWGSESERTHRAYVLIKTIDASDLAGLRAAEAIAEPSFADEMVATALVELHQNRIRSAIVHAVIAYEVAAKKALELLITNRLAGLESGAILEAISREVSTATLGRVVMQHATKIGTDRPVDWTLIDKLYNTRNIIVHRGMRRMPPFDDIKAQVLEIRSYVIQLQASLRRKQPE